MSLVAKLRQPSWSPYLGGVLLGVLVTVSVALLGHRVSGAGAYQALSGLVGSRVAPSSFYWKRIVPPGVTWDVLVAFGTLAGAFVSSRLGHTFRVRTMPDRGWVEVFGPRVSVRWAIAFLGSTLTEIGGGIAGGCTASLVVSGGALLVPAAFLFMAGMFATGIPTMMIVDALAKKRRGAS